MLMLDTPMGLLVMPMVLLYPWIRPLFLLPRPSTLLPVVPFTLLELLVMLMGILMLDLLLTPMVLLSQLNQLSLLLPVQNTLLLMLLLKNQIVCWNYLLQCCEFSSKYFKDFREI